MKSNLVAMTFRRALAIAGATAFATSVQAQDQQPQGLDEIIVTARKVAENLQDTPIAITAITGSALEERQVFSTDMLDQLVPNLQFANNAPLAGNNSSSAIFIRGIGQTDPTSTVDPGVGLYIDDVYIGNAVGGTMTLRDIANVQVLRGPQGTLFGRNTIGGAVLMSTVDPGDEFGGKVRAGFGDDNLLDGFLALDVPFAETLKTRLVAGNPPAGRLRDPPRWHRPWRHQHVHRLDQVGLETHRHYQGASSRSTTPSPTSTAARWCSRPSTRPRPFRASPARMPVARASYSRRRDPVPMIADPRCANDLQAARPVQEQRHASR